MQKDNSFDEQNYKILETQKELITHSYSQAMAYTNLIMLGGFASFFGLWKLTEPYLLKWQIFLSALLMMISVTTFVVFEIYKMIVNGRVAFSLAKTVEDPQKFIFNLMNHKAKVSKITVGLQRVWYLVLAISVPAGVSAAGILAYSYVFGLIRLL